MAIGVESDDDLREFFNLEDFAVAATIKPATGSPFSVIGIFENPVASRTVTSNLGVTTPEPSFLCPHVDVDSVKEGDGIAISGTDYTVRAIMTDGAGVATLVLERD